MAEIIAWYDGEEDTDGMMALMHKLLRRNVSRQTVIRWIGRGRAPNERRKKRPYKRRAKKGPS
ncbi:MAG: hypothetical protein AAF968_16880 [Pseudomonadota bacterium]